VIDTYAELNSKADSAKVVGSAQNVCHGTHLFVISVKGNQVIRDFIEEIL
jgi:hypothetical protein